MVTHGSRRRLSRCIHISRCALGCRCGWRLTAKLGYRANLLLKQQLTLKATDAFRLSCSVLFFSRRRSEGWPHHGRTFSIYPSPLSFWLTLPRGVLSTSWCCPSRPCVVFLACVHLTLLLALSPPGNSLVSSWYDHSMLVSLLWRSLAVSSLLQLC